MQQQPQAEGRETAPLFALPGDATQKENTVRFVNKRVKDSIKAMPDRVFQTVAQALYEAKLKRHPRKAKPLRGFGPDKVIEIKKEHAGDAYRVVYAIGVPDNGTILVLDAFKKKSHHGDELPREDKDRIVGRLAEARTRNPGDYDLW